MSNLVVPPVVQKSTVNKEFSILQALSAHYLTGKTLSAPVLMSLAAALAAEVNNVTSLSRDEKKTLVCDIVDQALQTALIASSIGLGSPAVSDEEKVALNYVCKNVIPTSVDLLVAASTGKLNLKTVSKSCCTGCSPCSSTVVAGQIRGPAWDVAETFVAAALASVAASKSDSVSDTMAAAVAAGSEAAESEVVVEVAPPVKKVTSASTASTPATAPKKPQ
jgi:hypothetical protein